MSAKHRPPIFTPGERLGATRLNRLARAAVAPSSGSSNPAASATLQVLLELEVMALDGPGRLLCREAGATAPATFSVDLPEVFSENSRGAVTYTYTDTNNRTAQEGSDSETQRVTPEFVIGETILAVERAADDTRSAFVFIGDGRMWAKV